MRTISITAYQFDELSDKAKERAREWYREGAFDYRWYDFIYNDAETIAGILGIALRQREYRTMGGKTLTEPGIYFSGFWSQGDGARFEGSYAYQADAPAKIREHAPQDAELHRIADELERLHAEYGDIECTIGHSGNYEHEHTMTFDYGFWDPQGRSDFEEVLRDFARWIYSTLETEYEWQSADEQVDDAIRANEYEFTEEGRHVSI